MSVQYVIAASVLMAGNQGSSPATFRKHLLRILPTSVVQSVQVITGGPNHQNLVGSIVLVASIQSIKKVNSYARMIRGTPYQEQVIHTQVQEQSKAKAADPKSSGVESKNNKTTPNRGKRGTNTDNDNDNDNDNDEAKATSNWKTAQKIATRFFQWLHADTTKQILKDLNVDLSSMERDKVADLFQENFVNTIPDDLVTANTVTMRRLEGSVMASLRQSRKMRSRRYKDGIVICSFATSDGKTFSALPERQTAREQIRQRRFEQTANKEGIVLPDRPFLAEHQGAVAPVNEIATLSYPMENTILEGNCTVTLIKVQLAGPHKHLYQIKTTLPFEIAGGTTQQLKLTFQGHSMGVYRANILLTFQKPKNQKFSILRSLLTRVGDSDLYDALKPQSKYTKPKRKVDRPVDQDKVVHPPKETDHSQGKGYKNLPPFKVPLDIRNMVQNKEMEDALEPPILGMPPKDLKKSYQRFWNQLSWISELQAYEDIKLYDMENVALVHHGRFFKLFVAGLYEGRPSVLKGDLVHCRWKGKEYRGRVATTELLDVLLEFHPSFHRNFNPSVDRVDQVRFTFPRTTFRTSHKGINAAPNSMGPTLLMPESKHVKSIRPASRSLPDTFKWASPNLNAEQKDAIRRIAEAKLRPMPYILFGPPGTGKTTTIAEAVYQLARLHTYHTSNPRLKILLVAPSNDAADILVERLASYFPPSEMLRVLAHTRSLDQVSPAVQPYVKEGLSPQELLDSVLSKRIQIVVSTINLAARIWCLGKPSNQQDQDPGYFDVLCVDEAGHATEPELVGVAALMNFTCTNKQDTKQLVLAGDPRQLGPIITSEVCKKFGMGVSYMERLITTSPAYEQDDQDAYPPDLVTFLVRNYRSHPSILKLPNERFYDNQLQACGDTFTTHSMARWEHLPTQKGFPILFHAVEGENLREGASPSWFNPQEAAQVVEYVKLLTKHSKPPIKEEDIGIITPYQRQVAKIRIAMKAQDISSAVKVGSVETFQGQERRCIIISTVRAENSLLEHDKKYNLGFVANEKRFNVAITRAKALLIVVGNPGVLATDTNNWLPLLKYCHEKGSWEGGPWMAGTKSDNDFDFDFDEASRSDDDANSETDEWHVVQDTEAVGFINREE